MNRTPIPASVLLLASLTAIAPQLAGQATPPPPETPVPTEEETVVLSPFVVDAEEDADSYRASSTLAGTRVRTELKDVASSISVVTGQFLRDTAAKNSQDLLVYTTNTEVGGVHGNFSGAGGAATYNENNNLLRPSNNTRVRGLDAADNTRDYFLTEIPWDGYVVDRVDLQRGPNSILFGVGSPAGIINASVNTATLKNAGRFENRIGAFGSLRNSFDVNRVIIPNRLAFRFAALDDRRRYEQRPAFNDDRRLFGALRYEAELLGDGNHTTVRANYENGRVRANRPRSLPPIDSISPWFMTGSSNGFANLNRLTLDPITTWNRYGNNPAFPNSTYPWFREAFMGRLLSSNIAFFHNGDSATPLLVQMPNAGTSLGRDSAGAIDGTISGIEFARPWGIATFNNYARTAVPGGKYYSNVSLSDPSIFNFYKNLMDGDNKGEWQDWDAANFAVAQTFFRDRLGFELVYDLQRYEDGQTPFLGGDQYSLSVDINTRLLDGSPNPNVGRPYVGNSGQYSNKENFIDRDSVRFTAFAELRADDWMQSSWLSKLLGRHVFTALASEDVKKTDSRDFSRWASDPAFTTATGGISDITNGARQIDWIAYVGPSLLNRTTASGADLSRVTTTINPSGTANVRYFDSHWNAPSSVAFDAPYTYTTYDSSGNPVTNTGTQADNPANYVGWRSGNFSILNAENGDIESLYSNIQKGRNRIKSKALTWQGYLWDGTVVPVVGWRKDEVADARTQAPKGAHNVSLTNFSVDRSDANTQRASGNSTSWGVVVHTPRPWRDKLPGRAGLSLFYNKSENFKADAPRGDIFGNQIANPIGETEDFGFAVSALDDRLTFKATWYETTVANASLQADSAGFSGNLYYVWALPYWGATHALAALDGIADPQIRQGNWGWPWNGIATNPDGSPDNARILAIVTDFFKNFPLDQHFVDEYGLGMDVAAMQAGSTPAAWYAAVPTYGVNDQGASNLGLQPAYNGNLRTFGSGPVASVDTTSKGVEFELTAQPTRNWNLTLNASKTTASRTAISPSIDTWIETFTEFMDRDAGLIRLWGGDPLRTVWANSVLAPYAVLKAQIGSEAPEIAPWRFNIVTNYNFSESFLRGTNVGLAYRWEDRRILGYQYDAANDVLDIDRPWRGPSEDHLDLWVGYQHKVSDEISWRVQLNLRNVGENTGLVPVNIQPDGTVALSRIREGMTWTLTNTFSF